MKTPSLAEIIRSFPERRIAVLGDLMLDVYLWGRVSRISPEAPVPVVNVVNRTCCLGGAGQCHAQCFDARRPRVRFRRRRPGSDRG